MYKFFQEKIKKPTDELVRLAEENRREWELPEDEIRDQFEDYEDNWEDEKINAIQ